MDNLFKALADRTRRELLDHLLANSGQSLGELCKQTTMSRQAVTKHLVLLEESNLITVVWKGREKLHYLNPVPIGEIYQRWISKFEHHRNEALILGGNNIEVFAEYLSRIDNPQHRARTEEVLAWVPKKFPSLIPKIAWNQPMFTDHGTFIIGFSVAKHHLAVAPERAGMIHLADEIVQAGYDHSKELVRIPWNSPIDFSLLEKMIEFNMLDKADCSTFWR